MHDTYEVFALKYGESERMRSDTFLLGDPHDAPMALAYYVWVVRNDKRTFVVDMGFDPRTAEERGRKLMRTVPDALATLGIEASRVTDVVVTHMHWDHAGNVAAFPNARFHIQDAEMAYVTGRCMTHEVLRFPFAKDHVVAMVTSLFEGRVSFCDPEDELAPGVTVHHVGGHSKGLMVVRVMTARGPMVLASDASHYYEHFHKDRVFTIVHNVEELLQGYRTMRKLAASDDHVIPGHDPLVLARYPAVSADLSGIVARLDVDPTG